MHPFLRSHIRIRQRGQTLVIALIVLGVLLILGLVFLGLINRNILNAARSQRRSESTDLAEAGIRYAHGQLVSSPLGADWRGIPTLPASAPAGPDITGDPDAYYLRPGSGLPLTPAVGQPMTDLGGPDGYGPYIRIPFPGGRALVRVRYGAADANPVTAVPGGPLRNLGAARSTIIIESVGRTGVVNPNDPTTFNATGGLRFRNFPGEASLRAGIAALAQADGQQVASRRLVGFAPIGIIDAARFETNLYNTSEPIELGVGSGLNATAFNEVNYRPNPSQQNIPADQSVDGLETTLGASGDIRQRGRFGGSLIANGNVLLHGLVHAYLNRSLGDSIRVAGRIYGSTASGSTSTLRITPYRFDGTTGNYVLENAGIDLQETGARTFNSQNPNFDTLGGLVMDGSQRTDKAGYPSGVGRLVPPSTQTVDPETKQNRYVALTRETGVQLSGTDQRNSGQYGHGNGVYVDNGSDRQEAADAEGRKTVGSQQSLFDDFLHPNSGQPNSGWKGPFYVPRGAVVQLLSDGFLIQRDGSAPAGERTWKYPSGNDSGKATVRYRIGRVNGLPYIVDSLLPRTTGQATDEPTLDVSDPGVDFSRGVPFNGVLYFEGNVRVRGTIPTGVQLTMVSGATIYVDGAITKGIVNNDVTGGTRGQPIASLPTATLMLMAKDNVVVNTTMFFGPTAGQGLESVNDTSGASTISPVRVRAAGGEFGQLETLFDLALDPDTTNNSQLFPNAWNPYALTYRDWDGDSRVPTQLLLAHTMDDGTGAASFMSLDLNYGLATNTGYPFPANDPLILNTAAAYTGPYAANARIALYGLGAEPWQRYSRFESRAFPLVDPNTANYNAAQGSITHSATFDYSLSAGGNYLLMKPGSVGTISTNDTLVGRVAVTPAEVRIEASMFAEQGSFFVLPGPWFNPNPNDTHYEYAQRISDLMRNSGLSYAQAKLRASRDRLEKYGSAPEAPFYGEPLDVRLTVVGSVAENLPPPMSVQQEWIRKWGWIPVRQGGSDVAIPKQHVPGGTDAEKKAYASTHNFVPNLSIQYDAVLATGRVNNPGSPNPIRTDNFGRPLPPMPRLPVSPKLSYFGEL